MNHIHPTAIIEFLPIDATVGAFCSVASISIGIRSNIRSYTEIYKDSIIGDDFTTGHGVLIRSDCVIGNRVSIGSHSTVEGNVTIGDDVRVHSGVFIPEFTVLEPGCWIGPGVIFTNSRYPNTPTSKAEREGVRVCKGAVIGAGAVILPGVVIGKRALIGAGAVVVDDVEDEATVVGNPARVIG